MAYSYSIDSVQKFSDLALARIDEDSLLATPENYELWFIYYSQSEPELIKAVDTLLEENQGKLSDELCYKTFHKFLSGHQEEESVQQAGDQIQKAIENVNEAVSSAKEQALAYNENLKSVSGELQENKSPEEINALLSNVMSGTDEMINHNAHLEDMLEQSNQAMEKMRTELEDARKEAVTDALTGLANRKAFDQEIKRLVELANGAEPHAFSLILLDIDHFKKFNDSFGHQIGDQVLKLVARTLSDGVKGRDMAVRYGGEEFAIFLPDTNIHGGEKVADILRREVEGKELINRMTGKKLAKITLSAGVAEYKKGEKIEAFIGRTDAALYAAKNAGRNCVVAA